MTFHDLYQHYATDVYRFALWLCGNVSDAEDIASETFVRAWAGKAPIRTETVRAYLLAIARNLHREQLRKASREADNPAKRLAPHQLPEDAVVIGEQMQQVRDQLMKLKVIDRAAFILRVQYEMPYAEISRILNLSLSATKVKVHRVRLKLARACEE